MTPRFLFAMLLGLAMTLAPFAMQGGRAMAATPGADHAAMMDMGHCGGEASDGKTDAMGGKPCCAAMCAAFAVSAPSVAEPIAFARSADRPTPEIATRSFLAKLPTPPPRAS